MSEENPAKSRRPWIIASVVLGVVLLLLIIKVTQGPAPTASHLESVPSEWAVPEGKSESGAQAIPQAVEPTNPDRLIDTDREVE